jgi:hypothetical protein
MAREWQPNGSNYDFWRSDNPLIQGWWRFGGVNPKNNFQTPEEKSATNYLSGILVDSGPQKHHLRPYFHGTQPADSQVLVPVASIAPWDPNGSGLQFRWLNTADNKMLYADPSVVLEGSAATHGTFSFGAPMYSGFTVIGWVRLPDKTPHQIAEQTIIARSDQDNGGLGTNVGWRVTWQQSAINGEYALNVTLLSNSNFVYPPGTRVATTRILSNSAAFGAVGFNETRFISPNFPKDRTQPFWFAAQFRREEVTNNRAFSNNGSGIIRVFIGTAASGLIASNSMFVRGVDIVSTFTHPDLGGTPLSIGADSYPRTNTTARDRHVASGAIFDEFIYVADGFLSNDRIVHYALSGIRNIEVDNPESSGFVPRYPGQDGLVAYWDFDQSNGNNTCTATASDPRLNLSLSGLGGAISFVSGINNGVALRVTSSNSISNTTGGDFLLASNEFPAIPAQSGLSLLFPSGQTIDEGMTVIGWMRSVPTGSNLGGGGFGWLGAGGRHNAFFTESITGTVTTNRNALSVQAHVSGAGLSPMPNLRFTSFQNAAANVRPGSALGLTNSASSFNAEYDRGDDGWHLWAGVYDLKAGQMYMVRDAKHLIQMTQQISSASGWSSAGLGTNDGFFGFFPVVASRSVEFDQFAVYNRILSIPEMSGFALNGIRLPVDAPLNTTLKSLVGYWPLNGFENYDPTGVSGQRVNDLSWYRHHLTNVSGGFTNALPLNQEFFDFANCIQTTVSGSMLSLERVFHGQNLDMSSPNLFSLSGMSAGAWIYLPSGDLQTQGNGSSGLYDDHMIMGSWDQDLSNCSWFLGVRDNKFHLKVFDDSTTLYFFDSVGDVPFNTPFFVGCNIFPSGSVIKTQVVYAGASETGNVTYAIDSFFGNENNYLSPSGPSGFSLLNAPNANFGFPSGTRIATAFVHLGYQTEDQWIKTKRALVTNIPLASGGVPTNDPANISHWRMNSQTIPIPDNGREQNEITLINTDAHGIGLQRAIHSSGIIIRQPEYLDTLPFNSQSRRLDLGSGTQSWTWLGWVLPNETPALNDRHVIMNKGGGNGNGSGIQIYMPSDALTLIAEASGITVVAQNGDLIPGSWNHLAVVYDRDNNKFTTVMNGRYAGLTQRTLVEVPVNNSGMALGGRGDQEGDALAGGSAFSGILDDFMIFSRALTLPEISGLAANSYNFAESPNPPVTGYVGGYLSGIEQQLVSGLIASYIHGMAQDLALFGGYVSGVSGQMDHVGGYLHGVGQISGLVGSYLYGLGQISGLYAGFLHGLGIASGVIGTYTVGAGEALSEFDISFNFQIVAARDFDSRLEVVKSAYQNFDAVLGVIRITEPPECELQLPLVGLVASGLPYTLTVQGSGWAYEDKSISKVRFTFSDFKGAESGTLIGGLPFSGLFEASRTFDTPGWYTIKMEVTDSYGYRHSCARPFLLVPSGSTSGAYLATLPSVSLTATPLDGSTIQRVFLTHSISGLQTTSGLLEYTDFADQQESLLNGLEMPTDSQFIDFVRTHDYTMPGSYSPVWAVSGSWGVVSDSISDGIDYT